MAGAKKFGTNIRIALLVLSGHVAFHEIRILFMSRPLS